jgi:hypothetical protein
VYLRLLLIHLSFNHSFVSWTLNCISSSSFSILINGSASLFLNIERGIRQGCPFSPLLFLLVVEALRIFINKAIELGNLKAITVITSFSLSHILFMHDIIIFCDGSMHYLEHLKYFLTTFCKSTSMQINKDIPPFLSRECPLLNNIIFHIFLTSMHRPQGMVQITQIFLKTK